MRTAALVPLVAAVLILSTESSRAQESPEPVAEQAAADPTSAQARAAEHEERNQRRQEWWESMREALFRDIELSPEQTRGVDAIIEAQRQTRRRIQQRDAELQEASRARAPQQIAALRGELREVQSQLKPRHEMYDEMRALLSDAQHPTFDMNRAGVVAEAQKLRDARP